MEEKKLFGKDFTLVVAGQIISLFGNAILRFALPLYLLRTTGSASLFGLVTASSFLPMIVLSLLGGVLADRVNKRNIMVGLDFSTAAIITVFYLVLDELPIVPLFIVVLMLLYGISGTYQPAVQASIPVLVSEEKLLSGNAVINQISALANLLGPVIGGMLYGAWGISLILIISIACFAFSAVMELFIHMPHVKKVDSRSMVTIVKSDIAESITFIKVEKPVFIRVIALVAGFNLILSAMIMVGIPILIVEILGMSDSLLGIAQGALALGGLGGGILTAVLGGRLRLKNSHLLLFICALCVFGMGVVVLLKPSAFICYLGITVMSFGSMAVSTMFSIQMLATVQAQTPAHLIGKVIACLMAFAMCAQPVGQVIYGFLFDYLKDVSWIILFGVAVISGIAAVLSKKVFRELETTHDNRVRV